ncbi:hypothetical protein M6D81_13860 [Paenibacillus sp. J5C_2022]|uniref:hypothetical protein n=1 Tax=Paenibacillus sp. J5C2022 TaxID=2977129 RepID=UPI0021D3053F|nr:hypothetical protein [Paenibacillus sp. J5C2022]MCU6709778.1 hypothetical protein [Paenibacillus sp. J5C2022]
MATEIGAIKARLELNTARFRQGTAQAKRDLMDVKIGAGKTAASFRHLESALVAVGASAALVGLVRTVKTLADEANQLAMSIQGVSEVAKALGHDVDAVTKAAEELASRGFMTVQESANALKATLSTGYGLDESIKLINAMADSAAYNREAHLSWGEAIVNATRGIKMQNSELTDAAGITTNLSVMYDRYAKSIGTSAGKLTDAQKAQAAYNGMMSEAAMFAGNAETAMTGYTGAQSEFNQTLAMARAELGEAYMPTIQKMTEEMTPLIKQFTGWASENKEVVSTVTATTTATLAFATAIGVLSVAIRGLNIALGPIGWAITAIGAVVTGISAYVAAANSGSETAREFSENQEALNAALEKTDGILGAQQYKQMQTQVDTLNDVLERRNELEDEYNQRMKDAEEGRGTIENTHAMFDLADAIKEINKELADMGYENVEAAEFALRTMKKSTDEALGALVDLTRQQMQSNIAAADNVTTLEALSTEYDELNAREKLSEEQKARLATIIKQLKQEYPDLNAQLDEENRWHIKNKDALDGYITGEKDRVNAAITAAKKVIQAAKTEAEERVRLASEAMNQIRKIEGAQPKAAAFLSDGVAGFLEMGAKAAVEKTKKRINDEINQTRFEINKATKLLDDLTVGVDAFRTTDGGGGGTDEKTGPGRSGGGSSVKKSAEKSAEQVAEEGYQFALKIMEKKRLLGQLTEQQEHDRLQSLAKQYEKYDDIWMDAESRRQRLAEQMAADAARSAEETADERFRHSADWITQEERRMTLAGESEAEIARMKLEAWSRVRSRYEKDSDYYKQADSELYRLRLDIIRETEQAEADAAKKAEASADNVIKAIDKQKKAELDALDERRKAIRAFYDEQAELIDDGERARERADLQSEIAKYSGATSEKGQRHLAELKEKLRKMDVEDQKDALEDERDAQLEALDRQQADIESWYGEMKTLLEEFNGDFVAIYEKTEDARYTAFASTNAEILAELERFKTEYESIMTGVGDGVKSSIIAQMQANAKAWHTADAEGKARLKADNQRLGAELGATYDGSIGKWLGVDGLPIFHNGGIVGQRNFSAGDMLMPDEVTAVLRAGEVVLTPGQIRSMLEGRNGGGNTYNIDRVVGMEVNDPVLEDEIDMRALGRTAVDMAAELRRSGYQNGGGSQ